MLDYRLVNYTSTPISPFPIGYLNKAAFYLPGIGIFRSAFGDSSFSHQGIVFSRSAPSNGMLVTY